MTIVDKNFVGVSVVLQSTMSHPKYNINGRLEKRSINLSSVKVTLKTMLNKDSYRSLGELAELAAKSCGVSFSVLSLTQPRRQWHGGTLSSMTDPDGILLPFTEAPLIDVSRSGQFLVIDPTKVPILAENEPLAEPLRQMRFIVCVPIIARSRAVLGALVLADVTPRELIASERALIEHLARCAASIIEEQENAILIVKNLAHEHLLEAELRARQASQTAQLAQQLHDDLANQLTGAHLLLEVANSELKGVSFEVVSAVKRSQTLIGFAIAQTRQLAYSQPAFLVQHNCLQSALEIYIEHLNRQATAICILNKFTAIIPILSPEIKLGALLIVEEAVTLARLRLQCQRIYVSITSRDGTDLGISISADGQYDSAHTDFDRQAFFKRIRYQAKALGAHLCDSPTPREPGLTPIASICWSKLEKSALFRPNLPTYH